jgi:hypothetical protein
MFQDHWYGICRDELSTLEPLYHQYLKVQDKISALTGQLNYKVKDWLTRTRYFCQDFQQKEFSSAFGEVSNAVFSS